MEISEFKGWLDPDEFLEWLQTVERVFKYKDVPQDKKVKLLAKEVCFLVDGKCGREESQMRKTEDDIQA